MMAGLESEVKSAMRDDPMASAFKDVVGSVRETFIDSELSMTYSPSVETNYDDVLAHVF